MSAPRAAQPPEVLRQLAEPGVELLSRSTLESLGQQRQRVTFFTLNTPLCEALQARCASRAARASNRRLTARRQRSQTLSAKRLLSAPVLLAEAGSSSGEFEGFVDVASILRRLLASLDASLLDERACDTPSGAVRVMDALTRAAPAALRAPGADASRVDGDLLYRGFSSASLLDVVCAAFVRPFHVRDVPICHRVRAAPARGSGSARGNTCALSHGAPGIAPGRRCRCSPRAGRVSKPRGG